MSLCDFPNCTREADDGDAPVMNWCALHKQINEYDCDYTEAITAANDLIPALIRLAEQGMCNDYLTLILRDLRVRAYDDAARYKLGWELSWAELDMDE